MSPSVLLTRSIRDRNTYSSQRLQIFRLRRRLAVRFLLALALVLRVLIAEHMPLPLLPLFPRHIPLDALSQLVVRSRILAVDDGAAACHGTCYTPSRRVANVVFESFFAVGVATQGTAQRLRSVQAVSHAMFSREKLKSEAHQV